MAVEARRISHAERVVPASSKARAAAARCARPTARPIRAVFAPATVRYSRRSWDRRR
jgi:hypothetical protein